MDPRNEHRGHGRRNAKDQLRYAGHILEQFGQSAEIASTTGRTSVSFLMSLSERPVVESATFSCILMRSSAKPVKAFLSNGWGGAGE
jgi:hypothetical protein